MPALKRFNITYFLLVMKYDTMISCIEQYHSLPEDCGGTTFQKSVLSLTAYMYIGHWEKHIGHCLVENVQHIPHILFGVIKVIKCHCSEHYHSHAVGYEGEYDKRPSK